MSSYRQRELAFALAAALLLATASQTLRAASAAASAGAPVTIDPQAERALISEWRTKRVESLTGDDGWLTLAGLFWLKQGDNSFGRAQDNALVLDNPGLAERCGTFTLSGRTVRFTAAPASGVTHDGQAVSSLELIADTAGNPTVLASGTLRFYLIERAGNLGVRVRDLNNPHRTQFQGLSYFP